MKKIKEVDMVYHVIGDLKGDKEIFASFLNTKQATEHIEKLVKIFPKHKFTVKER